MGAVRDQPVPDIVFVFKIEIERPLGDAGIFYDIRDRGLGQALVGKQLLGSVQHRVPLEPLVFLDFAHRISPWQTVGPRPTVLKLVVRWRQADCQAQGGFASPNAAIIED